MFNISLVNRTFQLWEYKVSHGALLIRSPKGPDVTTNIDIICIGVEYLSVPRFLRSLQIVEPTIDEVRNLEDVLGKTLKSSSVRIFSAAGQRFLVVATAFKIEENECDIFDSPFAD